MKNLESAPLGPREREAIEAAGNLLRMRFPVEKIILFGSKARGESDEYSDIDLLLITSDPLHWKEEKAIVEALFDLGMQYDVLFSPLFASSAEWEEGIFKEFPVYKEILEEGAVIP
jgi:predicted nucleotidyltransferase